MPPMPYPDVNRRTYEKLPPGLFNGYSPMGYQAASYPAPVYQTGGVSYGGYPMAQGYSNMTQQPYVYNLRLEDPK